jgi:hypothetical protein
MKTLTICLSIILILCSIFFIVLTCIAGATSSRCIAGWIVVVQLVVGKILEDCLGDKK